MADKIINGTSVFAFISTAPIGHATSHTLTIKMATRGTANKDSGNYETRDAGRLDVTASVEGLRSYGSFEALAAAAVARAPILLVFARKNTGAQTPCTSGTYASGYFFMGDYTETAPDAGNATYSTSFELCSGFVYTSGSGA